MKAKPKVVIRIKWQKQAVKQAEGTAEETLLLAVKSPSLLHCQTLDMFVIHNVNISIGTWARTAENFTLAIVMEHL